MYKVTKHLINEFLNCKTIAVAGVSRDDKSFSVSVVQHLDRLGYDALQINPNFENVQGNQFRSISELPAGVTNLLVLTPRRETTAVLQQAIDKGFNRVWIQQGCETPDALKLASENSIEPVFGECIFMFTQPEGFHKFHYRIKSFFGGVPK